MYTKPMNGVILLLIKMIINVEATVVYGTNFP